MSHMAHLHISVNGILVFSEIKKILDYKNYFIFFDSLVKAGVYYLILQADCSYLRISKVESEGISSSLEK